MGLLPVDPHKIQVRGEQFFGTGLGRLALETESNRPNVFTPMQHIALNS